MEDSAEFCILERIKELRLLLFKDLFGERSAGDYFTLQMISRLPADTAHTTNLAEQSHVSAQAISRSLNVLETKGLIHREPDPADRRGVRICLTPQGEQALAQDKQQLENFIGSVRAEMGEERMHQMAELLQEFYQCCSREAQRRFRGVTE